MSTTSSQVFEAPQPLISKSYTIALDKDEQSLAIPFCLHLRVAHAKYTWRLFLGAASPNTGSGSQGDVWVTTIPGYENVYIRGENDQWNVWHKSVDYGTKKYCNDKNKFLHSYHPWLRDRLLQFNGTDLGWHPRRLFNHHRVTWNAKRSSGHPDYESLDSVTVARYVKAVHLPRPTLFGVAQPTALTSSSSAPAATATRPTQQVQRMPSRPTTPAGVQLATPSLTSLQPTTVQQGHHPPRLAVPGGVQPPALTSLPPAPSARPIPAVRPAAPTLSTSFPPAVSPGHPLLQGLTPTGVKVQPVAPTSSTNLTTTPGPAPPGHPITPKPAVPGGVRSTAPSSTSGFRPVPAPLAQTAPSLPPAPPKYENVVSEHSLKRQRSSSGLSYASKEQSPSPKRPNLGKEGQDSGGAVQQQPPCTSGSSATPPGPPPAPAAVLSKAPAATPTTALPPASPSVPSKTVATSPSSGPAVEPVPIRAIQPSTDVAAVQPSPVPATHPPLTPAIQPCSPTPASPPQPPSAHVVRPPAAPAQNPSSALAATEAEGAPEPSPMDVDTGDIIENAPKESPPPGPENIDSFLSTLPLSLSHHSAVFTAMGVANADHVRLLAQLPKRSLDRFLATARERGLSFMESLVLRSALNGLRQTSVDPQAQAEPMTIEGWLQQIGPSMIRHAKVFGDLGIEIAHVPVLAQLDTESFQEFENALDAAGLAWIDRFAITSKIRDGGISDVKQEPLLVAS